MVRRAQEHDPEAWDSLCRLYVPLVYGWVRQTGVQSSDAVDIVQDVFHAVWVKIDSFRREGDHSSFRGWLWTITRNQVRLHFRQRALRPQATGGSEAQQRLLQHADAAEPDPSDSDSFKSLVNKALRLIRNDFQEKTWQAFWRLTIEGHSAVEIARDLGMTPQSVRQAKYRVLCRLRQELDE